jgi:glutamine synthetase
MFGLEQEFYVIDNINNLPVGFYKKDGYLSDTLMIENENKNYCGVGTINYKLRQFMDKVMIKLLELDISVTGMNMEVVPGQCEFQICNTGIKACDELMVLRFLLCKIGEEFNYRINFKNKPYRDFSGSGCHINFSTKQMRNENGIEYINKMLDKLKQSNPLEHRNYYGKNNYLRLTGKNETSKYCEFTFGIGCRSSSIRIPNEVIKYNCGYLEDRRPGANIDPYKACLYLFQFSL